MKSKLYLIDISSLFFRSYYAISTDMKSEKGLASNALYGTMKILHQLIRKKSPDYVIACFDSKTPSFRKKLYPQYKANRKEMPEDLEAQAPYLKVMMEKLCISHWGKEGFEADDLIASIVSQLEGQLDIFILSGDKDFTQIVSPSVFLYDQMKEKVYDPKGVESKWGLLPHQMQDYLSLMGDSSDNIPGVRGVGPKKALQLLKTYQSLEGIYQNIASIKGSLKEYLLRDRETAFLSKKLVALKRDIPCHLKLEEAKYKSVSSFSAEEKQALKEFLKEWSFNSLLKGFFPSPSESPKPFKNSWREAEATKEKEEGKKPPSLDQLQILNDFPSLARSKFKQLSIEEFRQKLAPYAEVQVGLLKGSVYIAEAGGFILIDKVPEMLQALLDFKWLRYAGHDLKTVWKRLKLKNPVPVWDSMIAGWLLNPGLASPSLESLLKRELKGEVSIEALSLQEILKLEGLVREKLIYQLKKENLQTLFQEIELPLIAVLYEMEEKGVLLDFNEIKAQSHHLDRDIKNLEKEIFKLLGCELNLSSPKQLSAILFEKLGLPKGRKIKTGWSTDSRELHKIKDLHSFIPLLLKQRELFKLKTTYTDHLLALRGGEGQKKEQGEEQGQEQGKEQGERQGEEQGQEQGEKQGERQRIKQGRIHTEFKQTGSATGRLSSIRPNLQNIPIRSERGRQIRRAFVAEEGTQLLSADYSQIELRILAHITGDENLKEAFERDMDIHSSTASEIFNVPLSEVSSDLRRRAKAVNFGIAYGQGSFGLSEALSISRAEAKEIIENYFKKFVRIRDYILSIKERLEDKNYVETIYGRKRFFNPEDLKNPKLRAGLERAAINSPLQGSAADLIKKAMIQLNESLPVPILSQVHDELLLECPDGILERESQNIISIMEENDILNVPLKIHLSVGRNWLEQKEKTKPS